MSAGTGSIKKKIPKVRFFWLLVALIGFILLAPGLPNDSTGRVESLLLLCIIFFSSVYVSQGSGRFGIICTLSVLLFASAGLRFVLHDNVAVGLLSFSTLLFALGYTSISILSFVLREGYVDAEHIYGAICAYVLLAMAFATLYTMLDMLAPDSFAGIVRGVGMHSRPWWQFFYFSFTTLSTVGYGDITPATMRARSFVIVEQLIAIFYVAIIIARLTGMYKARSE